MAYTTLPYGTFVSGTTISASQINDNGAAIINGLSDGTKDIGVNAITAAAAIDANGTLSVAGATTLSSTVRVAGAATFSAAVYAGSTLQCAGALTASSTASFAGAVYNESTVRTTGSATFSAAIRSESTLQCTGALTASSTASFAGATYHESTMRNSGASTFSGAVYADGTLQCTGAATFASNLYANDDVCANATANPYITTAVITGFTGTVTRVFSFYGRGKERKLHFTLDATSGISNTCGMTLPTSVANNCVGGTVYVPVITIDYNTNAIGYAYANGATVTFYPDAANSWTSGRTRHITGVLPYEVA